MGRLVFLDALRGIALILMVLNHTSRDWMDGVMGWGRYYLIYGTLLLPASIFLFLVGFCLPIAYHRLQRDESLRARIARSIRRGIGIVAAGYLLNVLITPELPLWNGGVLQTIGLAIIVLGPTLPMLRRRGTRWALVAIAVAGYLLFVAAHPAVVRWTRAHPLASPALFNDFPPWPWLSIPIIGLVVGWAWLEARAKGDDAERRFFLRAAAIGVVCLAGYLAWEWWIPTTPRFGFPRDFSVNRHWTPRGVTVLLVAGSIALLLSGTYALTERKRVPVPWLVTLGQNALMLYFVHQVIELTIVNKLLGVRFNHWPAYWIANVVFLVGLVYLARAWTAFKARRAGAREPTAARGRV